MTTNYKEHVVMYNLVKAICNLFCNNVMKYYRVTKNSITLNANRITA